MAGEELRVELSVERAGSEVHSSVAQVIGN